MPGPEEKAPAVKTDDDTRPRAAVPGAAVDQGFAPPPPPPPPPPSVELPGEPSEPEGSDEPPIAAPGPVPAPELQAGLAPLPVRPVRRFPASGEKIGRFTLGEVLGHGGFAHVYRATGEDGSEVALKVLTGLQDGARERFEQEAQLLEKVGGRGFPEFVQGGLDETQPWFAMELVGGSTLRDHVRAAGPLDAHRALRLADQLASALLVLQEQRCLHRDLKPANVMVDGDRAVLIDLGIAKVFDAATSTQPVGTLSYMAPELFARRVHPRSDVYSLGLLLVFASTGNLPPDLNFLGRDLEAEDLVEEMPGEARSAVTPSEPPVIDKHLRWLILSMTRYQPNHRPALENIARVLRARLAGEAADNTLLLTERVADDGATAAEQSLGPVAGLATTVGLPAHAQRATKVMAPRPGAEADVAAARAREPWHALVYDAALMSVLCEVHGDGFDGAAEQVIADHVASIGAHVADGRTPAEIKDWIWQAMRWRAATPPDGHTDTLRGWRTYRNPKQVAPTEVARSADRDERALRLTQVMRAPDVAATQVTRPTPPTYHPRKSPVKHLGPAPQPPSVQPRNAAAAGGGTRPRPAAPVAGPPAAAPLRRGTLQPPSGSSRPTTDAYAPSSAVATAARRRPRPARAGGVLLRLVPRLLLLAAVLRMVLLAPVGSLQRNEPMLGMPPEILKALHYPPDLAGRIEGPLLALAALVVAGLLRAAGHRMLVWLYTVAAFGTIAAAVVLT
ncbi:serine/threonine protein kinase [Antribacter sp. KLBMP9083]|uniref:Serine/threonine protein kinase n=1 Tax=Antribacter soli TaxID=2910976 RepID=A0AA41QCR5_9MICO|nr:serine/threonine-protein kinase [Antribacter soli]MCF4120788.1 serine/threonine protein kinase [Antribacter soli]